MTDPDDAHRRSCWIDVRDLAQAHVLAIQKQEAGGERIIVSEGPYKWQDFGEPNQHIVGAGDKELTTHLSQLRPHRSSIPTCPPEMSRMILRRRRTSLGSTHRRPRSCLTSNIDRLKRVPKTWSRTSRRGAGSRDVIERADGHALGVLQCIRVMLYLTAQITVPSHHPVLKT